MSEYIDDIEITDDVLKRFYQEETEEEKEERIKKEREDIERRGYLPVNDEFEETMTSPQEVVEKNPRKYIIEECIPACKELWSKNIYTFMVSDHLNDGECWIELDADALSDDNKSIYLGLDSNEVKKFSYHRGAINFGVRCVGKKAQEKLLEIAQKFEMQDVQEKLGYISIEKFLMDYCECYEEYENPEYIEMKPSWEMENLSFDELANYMMKYDEWQSSIQSMKTLKRFCKKKLSKSLEELVKEHGMILEGERVYLSKFHYDKHKKYVESIFEDNNGTNNGTNKSL